MRLPFTLQQLRCLKAVCTEKNIKIASKVLFISKYSLNKQITDLENQLGILLVKKKNNIKLTNAGKLFLSYCERILYLCEESCSIIKNLKQISKNILYIGISRTIYQYLLPYFIILFNKKYPKIKLILSIKSSTEITKNIKKGFLHLGIIDENIPYNFNKKIEYEDFIKDKLLLIINKSSYFSVLAAKKVKIIKLLHYNFLLLNKNLILKKIIEQILNKNYGKIPLVPTFKKLYSIESIKIAIMLNLGVSFIFLSNLKKKIEFDKIKILLKKKKIYQNISLLINNSYSENKSLELFYRELWYLTTK